LRSSPQICDAPAKSPIRNSNHIDTGASATGLSSGRCALGVGSAASVAAASSTALLVRDAEFVEHPEFFRRIGAPVTLVWREKDDVTPLWQGEMLAKLLPSARLVVLAGVGHVPQIEDPAAFQRTLRDALAKFEVGRRPLTSGRRGRCAVFV
jgi:pimeloyl-ACP methyl ester carboxylesterase